jgi:hypothetical protein
VGCGSNANGAAASRDAVVFGKGGISFAARQSTGVRWAWEMTPTGFLKTTFQNPEKKAK